MFDERVLAQRPGRQALAGQVELQDLAAPFPPLLGLGPGDLKTDANEVGS